MIHPTAPAGANERTNGEASAPAHRAVQQPWTVCSAAERRRRALAAAASHDVAELVSLTDTYMASHALRGSGTSAQTRRAYATSVRILLAAWRHEDLVRPPGDAAARWLDRLRVEGAWRKDGSIGPASPATLRVRLAGARMLYRALAWAGATDTDPFASLATASCASPAVRHRPVYTRRHLEQLRAAAGATDRTMLLLREAGLRVSELCSLRWNDVDPASGLLHLRRVGDARSSGIAAPAALLAALASIPHRDGTVLGVGETGARKRMRALCARAGVPYLGLEALRPRRA